MTAQDFHTDADADSSYSEISGPSGPTGELSKRTLTYILVLGLVVIVSAWISEVDPVTLFGGNARSQMWAFIVEGLPPDLSREYLLGHSLRDGLLWAVIETVAISIVGIVLAVAIAIPLALTGAANVTHRGAMHVDSTPMQSTVGRGVYRTSHSIASFLRSVPDLVWGFLFVTAVGLGPFAGVLAIAIHNGGILGKMYAEFMEDTDERTIESVYLTGGSRVHTVAHGIVPQVVPTLVSYTLYRWECAIRAATILGFVGAGGIGYYLTITISRLQYPRLLTAILVVFVLVVSCDRISEYLRGKLL